MEFSDNLLISDRAIFRVRELLQREGSYSKILLLTGPHVDRLYGAVVLRQLAELGDVLKVHVEKNEISFAMQLAEDVITQEIDLIVGLGGGKALDVSKYAAYIAKRPLLSIPTTISNDGIASPIAVLKRVDGKPMSLGCRMPSMMVLDTEILLHSPRALIQAGIGDTISNYMALRDWKLACRRGKDTMNGYAYLMSQTSLDVLMRTEFDDISPGFIEVLARSLVLSGIAMSLAGSSRPVSGSEHLFSHALDYFLQLNNLHGLQTALGTVVVLKLIGEDASAVERYLRRFHVDINPAHMKISEENFVYCLQHATDMRKHRYTYLHEVDLDTEQLKRLYAQLLEEWK
ncbi:hypothetical protein HMPREF9334_01847 [Selenomonas infelix ATCC 43532]|uniref:Uncharacterized protein n=1 Tax=Selenomonas infelix ATCC 43532 TaxID=679201 RepID=G5GRG6_9FIRM|nr:iron-containing alcohol dehydrogenase family protein [Selenomonas infelix]EHG19532.1 hypothetical protein HMPREF9334_01847 [Selenomonas infelix ATCC 43532]